MQEEISQSKNQTEDLNALGAQEKPSEEKTPAQEGEVAGEVANLAPGEACEAEGRPKKRVLCQDELDRIRYYAKKVKAKPWSDDILWLLDQLGMAINVANETELKAMHLRGSLDKITNGGFAKLGNAVNFLTEMEEQTLTLEQKEQKAMEFLHKQTCCKCGEGNTWPPAKHPKAEK